MRSAIRLAAGAACLVIAASCNTTSYAPSQEVVASVPALAKPKPPCPAKVKFVGSEKEKGYRKYQFDLTITNPTEKPRWFVFRYNADNPLQTDEIFSSLSPNLIPFASDRLDSSDTGGKGKAIQILYKGKHPFIAFRLLPNASVKIDKFEQIAYGRYKEFEVWQARDILVNSNTPLEDWLPYNVMSDKEVVVTGERNTRRLDLNRKGTRQRTDYPKEKVLHLWVCREQQWSLPMMIRN